MCGNFSHLRMKSNGGFLRHASWGPCSSHCTIGPVLNKNVWPLQLDPAARSLLVKLNYLRHTQPPNLSDSKLLPTLQLVHFWCLHQAILDSRAYAAFLLGSLIIFRNSRHIHKIEMTSCSVTHDEPAHLTPRWNPVLNKDTCPLRCSNGAGRSPKLKLDYLLPPGSESFQFPVTELLTTLSSCRHAW